MPGILSEINKRAFVIAPVFWHMVYRSIAAVCIGFAWVIVCKLFKKVIAPNGNGVLCLFIALTLISPSITGSHRISLMRYIEPVEDISYRYAYDVVQQQVHIAMQTDGDDMIDGLTDTQLMEKEKQVYYKSLVFDVALPLLWLAGVAAGCGWFVFSAHGMSRKIRQTGKPADDRIISICENEKKLLEINRQVNVIITDYVSVPAATGFLKKKILLPSYVQTMDDDTIRYIILHELCHIKRGDVGYIYLHLVLRIIYWFNPLLAVLFNFDRQGMEMLTDMRVVEETGESKPYITAMVTVLAYNSNNGFNQRMLCMADGVKNMKQRIESMKRKEFFEKHNVMVTAVAIVLGTVVQLLFLPTATEEAEIPIDFDTGIYYGAHIDRPTGWKQVSVDINNEKFYCTLPDNWVITADGGYETQSGLPLPLGDFSTAVNITDGEYLIGYVGISSFEPYTEEIPPESYHQTVWPVLRLGSFRGWDPFNSIAQTETGESGTVDIWYVDDRDVDKYGSMAAAPHYETNGVLAYDKEKKMYVGFGFVPSAVSDDTATQIAQSIVFE